MDDYITSQLILLSMRTVKQVKYSRQTQGCLETIEMISITDDTAGANNNTLPNFGSGLNLNSLISSLACFGQQVRIK